MTAGAMMTIRIGTDVKEKLERLARGARRSKSDLAAEAVSTYVEREFEIIEGIQRGFADIEAGRVVSNDPAMTEIYPIVDGA